VGKESAARVLRMCGADEGNRAAMMRARAVEPLVELLQGAGGVGVRDEAAGALLSLGSQRQLQPQAPAVKPTLNM
jgi:hypothetical protein